VFTQTRHKHVAGTEAELIKGEYGDPGSVYPFGMDPSWHISENELLFYNSMKMKMSVVLGIFQMTLGILLKASNARFFNQPLDLYLEFLPMIIFDMALFGYMVILIFLKWSINWDARMYSATCLPDTLKTPWGLPCIPGKTTVGKCDNS
jgi:V-type H+-transporting ATPase subunit a